MARWRYSGDHPRHHDNVLAKVNILNLSHKWCASRKSCTHALPNSALMQCTLILCTSRPWQNEAELCNASRNHGSNGPSRTKPYVHPQQWCAPSYQTQHKRLDQSSSGCPAMVFAALSSSTIPNIMYWVLTTDLETSTTNQRDTGLGPDRHNDLQWRSFLE